MTLLTQKFEENEPLWQKAGSMYEIIARNEIRRNRSDKFADSLIIQDLHRMQRKYNIHFNRRDKIRRTRLKEGSNTTPAAYRRYIYGWYSLNTSIGSIS